MINYDVLQIGVLMNTAAFMLFIVIPAFWLMFSKETTFKQFSYFLTGIFLSVLDIWVTNTLTFYGFALACIVIHITVLLCIGATEYLGDTSIYKYYLNRDNKRYKSNVMITPAGEFFLFVTTQAQYWLATIYYAIVGEKKKKYYFPLLEEET